MADQIKCKSALHLLRLRDVSIYDQLKIEEALLRADNRNWLVINSQVSPAIVMGISGRLEKLVDCALVARRPIPIIKRFSGGGTVVVDEGTFFTTFICNEACTGTGCFPEKVHSWVEPIFRVLFDHPDFALRENDYVFGDRKFGGNAQYLQKGRWLHHTSFLWDFDHARMNYLLHPEKKPKYRLEREHGNFLCRLKDYMPSMAEMEQRLVDILKGECEVRVVDPSEIEQVCQLPHRRATKIL